MSWELNRLLKTTGVSYIPGSPAIPGSEGTTGSPAYTYWAETIVPGATYGSPLPPEGWDTEIITSTPGGGTVTFRSGGYRYFDGVKAYLTTILAGVEYIYVAETQTVLTEVTVPAVAPTPAVAPVPATEAELIEDYNLGWNSGALGPATLAVNTVFRWRMSAGNVGTVIGLTLSTAPQDYGYTGMSLSVLAQSGSYQLYRGGVSFGASARFTDNTRFALSRTNAGTVELYVDGGLVHTEALAADVVVDCSMFSGGDVVWDAEEIDVALVPLNSNLGAVSVSDAQAVASAIAITRTIGPGTALGVAGATTVSRAVSGQVNVNGSVYVDIGETSEEGGTGGGKTLTAAVGVAGAIAATPTFGPGTANGLVGATTTSAAVAAGDTTTGVGISTNGGSGDPAMLPLAGAGSGPNVAVGWTGNYVGDAMRMRPLTATAAGDLVEPSIGIASCVMVPMDGDAGGVTGGISISSSGSMLPMRAFASSEAEYSYGYVSLPPLIGLGSGVLYEGVLPSGINVFESILVSGSVSAILSFKISELLRISSPVRTFYQSAVELLDSAGAAPSVELAVITFITETYNVSDAITYRQALQVAEALVAEGQVETVYHGIVAVLSAILAGDGGGSGSTGTTGGGTVVDGTGSEDLFPAGSVITVTYETDTGGTTTITTTLVSDSTAQEVAVIVAALLDAEPDISAVATGSGAIEISPEGGATTVLITGSTGGGDVTDPTGDAGDPADIVYTSDPADILLTGWFPAGSTVTVTYSTDTGGTDSVTFTVTQDSTAAQVAEQVAALLDAQDDVAAIHTGGGAIEVTPEDGATTVTIVSVNVTTPSLTGDPGTGAIAAYAKTVAEAVAAADAINYLFQMLAVMTDGVGATDTLQNILTITVLETAEVEVDDTLDLSAQYFGRLLERVEVLAMIKTPAEMAQGWVMNTEGAMPISEYDNYVFNSMAYSPDEMLGCTDQGLYILDGEDDAGANIDAHLTSLMLDFKTSKLKRMSTAYLGYRSNGTLLLKVRSVEQGVHAERWYEARSTAARTTPGQNRMKIGKGLRSRYWTFELVNVDGSDFELDKVELYPIVLDRRI